LSTADVSVVAPSQPTDVVNFGQVRNLPQLLAGLLGIVAAVTMAYLLVSSIRRRRRDLAILKTLGLVPRQVSVAIAWQATTVVLVSTAVGLPLGLAAGRSAWSVAAGQIGVVVRPTVPWAVVLGLVPLALLIANLVAAGPALAAGRIRPAAVLRSE
jgi:ABC-type antimicrobial peptide transport system permease subunit